jgi:flagellar assembly protein FliH
MSSKVLRGAAAVTAASLTWPQAGRSGPRLAAERHEAEPDAAALGARLEHLEQEAERREQQAFAAGFRKGEAAGREQASAQIEPALEKVAATVAELGTHRRKLRRDAEEDLVKLAVAIARRVLRRELQVDPDALLGVVKAALDKLEGREIDRVRVNPVDAPALQRLFERMSNAARIEVVADERLERGAAIFDTARGSLDASVETQLLEIQRGLADRIR